MGRVRERIRHRQLGPVRDAVQRDLVEPERLADGLEVLGVLGRAVEGARRADLPAQAAAAARCWSAVSASLHRGAVEQPRLAGAAVVVGDERVAGEEEAEEADAAPSSRPNTWAEPGPGPPAIRKIAPRGVPGAGTTSTCSETVPGTWPVRSSGTTTWEQTRPAVVPQGAALEAAAGTPGARPKKAGCGSGDGLSVGGAAAAASPAPKSASAASRPAASTPRTPAHLSIPTRKERES